MGTELYRALRHGVAPLVLWLIANGYLPEYMREDITELLTVVLAIGVPYALSWWRDRLRGRRG
jgi:hypothetical protein